MNIRNVLHRLRTRLSFLWAAIPSLVLALGASPVFGQPSVEGQWVQPKGGYDWPLKTKDAIQLPTGKVLVWENLGSSAKLYDPTNGKFSDVPLPVPPFTNNVHCPGHAFLSDGTLLVAGGGQDPRGALDETRIFDPDTEQWQEAANLNLARWYPTCTTLPDGRVLAVVGKDASGLRVVRPEIYHPATSSDPDAWVLMGPQADVPWFTPTYPFMFVLPDGKVFYAGGGSGSSTFRLDIDSETWEPYPGNNSIFGGRKGAAVMYEPGKILKCGGQIFNNAPIEQRTAMIDLTDPTPTWDSQAQWDLPEERKDHNLVLLPDGKILLVGGENDDGFIHSALM